MRTIFSCLAGLLLCAAASAQVAPPLAQRESLNATLWVQHAAEFKYASEQIYRQATEHLNAALRPGTASIEQALQGNYAKLPPAIVLDVDETTLDNAAYQGWVLKTGQSFSDENFRSWVRLQVAKAMPGAVAFTQAAARAGIKLFYMTNRSCEKPVAAPALCAEKAATMANMRALGFAGVDDPAAFMIMGDQPGWNSDKTSRRTLVAQHYRIVMMLGDDLRDFMSNEAAKALRNEQDVAGFQSYLKRFGERWFILPNAIYGSWLNAIPAGIEARYANLDSGPADASEAACKTVWRRGEHGTPGDKLYCATTEGKANSAYCSAPLPRVEAEALNLACK